MAVTDVLSAALVPIDSARRTHIRFALPIVPTLVGLANHWRARATAEGVSGFGAWHTTNQILRLDCQAWPATNSSLTAMCAIDAAYLSAYPLGVHWNNAVPWYGVDGLQDWCTGYLQEDPSASDEHAGVASWLVVEVAAGTQIDPAPFNLSEFAGLHRFVGGTVRYEGTRADAIAYRDANY